MSLKKQFLWSLAPLLVVSAINIISVPLFYRYLGADLYAVWLYVTTFTGIFGFADLGLGVAVGRYIGVALGKGDQESVREYWGTGNLIAIPLLGFMAALFIILGIWLGPRWFNVPADHVGLLRGCFVAGGLALFFNYYGQVWNILLQAHLDFKFSSALRIGSAVLQIIPSVLLAMATRNPLAIVFWGALVGLVQLLCFMVYARSHYHLGFNLREARVVRAREMSVYTGKTFAALLMNSLLVTIDRVILGKLAPASGFTDYNIAANVGTRFQSMAGAIMGPVFHNTSRAVGGKRPVAAADIYNESFTLVFEWCALVVIWAAVWHPVVLRVWLGDELGARVAPLFTPLLAAFCLNALASIANSQLGALNRVGLMTAFNVAAGLLAAAGVWLGWKWMGLTGAAYGFLLSRAALVAQDLYLIVLLKGAGWLSWRPWLELAGQGAFGAFLALCYLILPRHSFWLLIPATVHGAAVSAWLLRHFLKRLLPAGFWWGDTAAISGPPSQEP